MTKFVRCGLLPGLLLLALASACGDGFNKDEPNTERHQEGQTGDGDEASLAKEYLELLNEHRIERRLRPLQSDPIIVKESKEHSKGMALNSRPFGHHGMDVRCRRIRNRMGPTKICAEVVAQGQKTAKAVLRSWLNSPGHRSKIEGAGFTHTGVGVHKNAKGQIYWTQILIEF